MSLKPKDYWDSCAEAGSKQRARTAFAEARPTLQILSFEKNALVSLAHKFNICRFLIDFCFSVQRATFFQTPRVQAQDQA